MWMRLAGAEVEAAAAHPHLLIAQAHEVHLDAALARIVDRLVPEGVEIEGAAELAIDAGEQVEVEGRGHARRVVVGRHQRARVLLEVDADDQPAAGRQHGAEHAQQAAGLDRREIADRRARERSRSCGAGEIGRQRDRMGEVADDGAHVEARESAPQAAAVRPRARSCETSIGT